ncbi:hypothetical protein NC653_002987 [Populus alba x Populus x berolinensis]|uniref:Uncharacterized protein n=1 Tax=Populus alba x Populus x berolinensis TaxID=444605 RepID=A0AAD6WI27_9ROSI|nr:hypothetical protein NC653_002987 [Populus alba x Populus x berolinensis]
MARDSCLARITAGVAVGGAIGGAVGAVYGTYEAVRYKKVRNSQNIMACIGFCHPHFSVWAEPVSLISPEMLRKICFLVSPLVLASGCLCLLSGVDFVKLTTLKGHYLVLDICLGP